MREKVVQAPHVSGASDSKAEAIQGILFDFDDTLQDRDKAFRKYADDFCKRHFPTISEDERLMRIEDMAGKINGGYIDRQEFFQYLIDKWRWKNPPSFPALVKDYNTYFPLFSTLFADTLPVLTELRRRGYALGIVTNGVSELQNKKLDVCGLRPLMDTVVVSGDYAIHKPDRRIFDIAANCLGLSPERIVFVGDHPINDLQGAQNAGMQVIRMMQGVFVEQSVPDTIEICTLKELFSFLPAGSTGRRSLAVSEGNDNA